MDRHSYCSVAEKENEMEEEKGSIVCIVKTVKNSGAGTSEANQFSLADL